MADFDLTLAFDRDTPEFARGVEVGMLWERLSTLVGSVQAAVHIDNVEMVFRAAEAKGLTVVASASDPDDEWIHVEFLKAVTDHG